MEKLYELIVGTVLFLVGVFGFLFRSEFGFIPAYLLVINIVFGLWGLVIGFMKAIPRDTAKTTDK